MNKSNILLVTDSSHPEIYAIARSLSSRDIPFTMISSVVFDRNGLLYKLFVFILPRGLKDLLNARSINLDTKHSRLVRVSVSTFLLTKFLNKLPNRIRGSYWISLTHRLDTAVLYKYSETANSQQRLIDFSHIVYLTGIQVSKEKDFTKFIEIAYHGNIEQELYWREIAISLYPDWSNTWKPRDVNYATRFSDEISKIPAHKKIYASSFNAHFLENQGLNVCVPIGAVKKGAYHVNMKRGDFKLLHVGNLGLRKGIPVILEVAPQVKASFILAGNGTQEGINIIKSAKIPNLHLQENPSNFEITELMRSSHAFILPSFYEGFGIAILEAMSFGCIPIVSRNTCGIDIVKNSELENFLISPGDKSSLEKAINELMKLTVSEKLFLANQAVQISSEFTFEKYGNAVVNEILS
jgi:glycosyltransferase involved in cell wall biosynthesis